jgi:IS1 transposase
LKFTGYRGGDQLNCYITRKTICFSRSILMHDLVIGLFINRYEFGYAV